ncbi:FixH family protein [Capnocytophaga sp. ARDL2]|uniref:FixH family protein n=1 Tax=Capnocytophaga sp. ARDL2 TaxID=3238809 RepID=UPI00355741A0
MKWNWGTGLVVGMLAFMIFILQYVIRVQVNPDYDNELQLKDYYQEEVNIDKNHRAQQNANELGSAFSIAKNQDGIVISFPETMEKSQVVGQVKLYRPSNQKLDTQVTISLKDSYEMLLPKEQLQSGKWEISVSFSYQGKEYLKKIEIVL